MDSDTFGNLPSYYAVIFTSSFQNEVDLSAYQEMAKMMLELAKDQPGFLGYETAREEVGITVSYWQDLESISKWKENEGHLRAQVKGRQSWYSKFKVRICRVEREYDFCSGKP